MTMTMTMTKQNYIRKFYGHRTLEQYKNKTLALKQRQQIERGYYQFTKFILEYNIVENVTF